ncbi:MAG: ribose-5-phosphate isomerase RpiA [Ignavibacteria bacterium]|jgi:ribose 5-phosphate isomerase A
MGNSGTTNIREKQNAANKAVEFVKDGMTIGLGTGSTINFFLDNLDEKIRGGINVTAVSTSAQTTKRADALGIDIKDLNDVKKIDVTFDGADEVDPNLNGIKGGGGALLYEKIVAEISEKNIWLVDSTKYVNCLGKFPLPIEVVPFGSGHLIKILELKGYNPKFRMNGKEYFLSDGGHKIIDLHLDQIDDIKSLNTKLLSITGIIETGLFLDICDVLIIGESKECRIINKKKPA